MTGLAWDKDGTNLIWCQFVIKFILFNNRRYDHNHNGNNILSCIAITYHFIRQGNAQKKSIIEALNNPQNDAKLRNAFNQYDPDKSGTLTLEKFTDDFFKILLSVSQHEIKYKYYYC